MSLSTDSAVGPVRKAHKLNEEALLEYLRSHVAGFPAAPMQVFQFGHGQSNPTYLLVVGPRRYVLRKKPPGQLLKSAHAVEREYQVLAALRNTDVPVPAVHCLCTDASVIGTPFYIMDYVQGRIFTDPQLPGLDPEERAQIYDATALTMAAMHRVDVDSVGLSTYGRRDSYCSRQVERWAKQYAASTGKGGPAPDPAMLRLIAWLRANVPPEDAGADGPTKGLVHGDFRLDNLVFHPTQPRVLAVLDWELSTLGNQMSDAAYCCMPYHLPANVKVVPGLFLEGQGLPAGIPSEAHLLARYCQAAGVPWPGDTYVFYQRLSLFRAAAIFAGVYRRALQGNASSEHAASTGVLVSMLTNAALNTKTSNTLPPAPPPLLNSSDPGSGQSQDSPPRFARPTSISSVATLSTPGSSGEARLAERNQTGHSAGQSQPLAGKQGRETGHGDANPGDVPPSAKSAELKRKVEAFMAEYVYPNEAVLEAHAASDKRWTVHPLVEELKEKAKAQGLWNLWLPADSAALAADVLRESHVARSDNLVGAGLSNLEYAHVCGVMGRSVWAPELFNCSAPDTGNMEVLLRYGNAEQQKQWLLPLLEGRIRSCFAMTEPQVASSDATNIEASIVREGETLVLNGRKWWTSGACDPRCRLAIFMGKSSPKASPYRQQSMVLVDMQSPGVTMVRPLTVFGFDDAPHGHAEVLFENVRVPAGSILLGEGRGFEIAQGRLGPGRLHHCMRLIGASERGLEAMARRSLERKAFGRPLAQQGAVLQQLGACRVEVHLAHMAVLNAALQLDLLGNKKARHAIAIAKVAAPRAAQSVLDAAMQVHGGAGVSGDFPLARLWVAARTLRIADGPDEVHLGTLGRAELERFARL